MSRPKLDCGAELYSLARRLLRAREADAAAASLANYAGWCSKWERFLREFSLKDGRRQYVHERLRKARRALNRLVQSGELFAFVGMTGERGGRTGLHQQHDRGRCERASSRDAENAQGDCRP